MKKQIVYIIALVCAFFFLGSCVKETPVNTNHKANFDALWKIIDERYCYLEEKKVDWDTIYTHYAKYLEVVKGDDFRFFNMLSTMLRELKDGHVNLISTFNVGRYDTWQGDPTEGYNYYIRKKILGKNYLSSGGMKYVKGVADSNKDVKIGYILYESFASSLGDLRFIFNFMDDCQGLIIDIRGNGGGLVNNANTLVSCFIDETHLVGYYSYKTGPGRGSYSPLKPEYIAPRKGDRWTDKPVVILQDRGCYSAANDFLSKVRVAKNVVRIGLPSGGGGGLPAVSELPNGWRVRYSAVRGYDRDTVSLEGGVDPDIYVANEIFDVDPDAPDRIMGKAIEYIVDKYKKGKK
ncbi:S41 family peptidase [Porphyromonas sp.]|uniref:S41 family peptidase n=1 Tax=Porphyromonas sp. TaxID=1924944 RepID=UPI0026DB6453|nr:S41 family peptidase [Porphyromonas sp.]MDO4695836.1 S41 family peptidase [Porphyromonas sp.]MDO4771406.1 S41 family peptidase [Porphyromonas sp.]